MHLDVVESSLAPDRMRRVLLVDDHAGFRSVVATVLGLGPGQFMEAANGIEALDACRRGAIPDLIVMDWDMPAMDGIEATRRILLEHPDARIVILTQHDEPSLRDLALAAGACAFVAKVDLSQLPAVARAT